MTYLTVYGECLGLGIDTPTVYYPLLYYHSCCKGYFLLRWVGERYKLVRVLEINNKQ